MSTAQTSNGRCPAQNAKPSTESNRCPTCGGEIRVGDWPLCGGDPSKHQPPGRYWRGPATRFDPVVVFRGPGGQISVPGHNQEKPPPGFIVQEIRDVYGVRKLQKELDQRSLAEHEQAEMGRDAVMGPWRKQKRANLLNKMSGMSEYGKDFVRLAMKKNDEKPSKRYTPNNHIDAFENDASNRRKHRDRESDLERRA